MKNFLWLILVLVFAAAYAQAPKSSGAATKASSHNQHKYLWLEDVTGEKALTWVKERNTATAAELESSSDFKTLEGDLLKIMDSKERIPMIGKNGPYYYNYWKDDKNPRGIWRRTTLKEYRNKEPKWEVILDVDASGRPKGSNGCGTGRRS